MSEAETQWMLSRLFAFESFSTPMPAHIQEVPNKGAEGEAAAKVLLPCGAEAKARVDGYHMGDLDQVVPSRAAVTVHFHDERKVSEYQQNLRDWILGNV